MSSHFNKACQALEWAAGRGETGVEDYAALFRRAALFRFHGHSESVTPKWTIEVGQKIASEFFLPFPTTAVEDNDGVLVFSDFNGGVGLLPENAITFLQVRENKDPKIVMFESSIITKFKLKEDLKHPFEGVMSSPLIIGCTKKATTISLPGSEISNKRAKDLLVDFGIGLRQILSINHPKNWVVRVSNERLLKRKVSGIRRSHERIRYLVVSDDEVLRVIRPKGDGPTPRGHRRRKHWRVLRSERYGDNQGKRIPVEACWVGPKETTIGGERYEVALDL